MIKKILLFLTFGLNTFLLFSQSNLIKGYIIHKNNDTVSGFIDFLEWKTSPKKVSFYKGVKEEKTNYEPHNIMGFGLDDGTFYESTTLNYNLIVDKVTKLNGSPPERITEAVFLRRILQGSINLYEHYNRNSTYNYFIKKENDTIQELIYYKIINKSNYLQSIDAFKSQLLKIIDDKCPKAAEQVRKSDYKLPDLFKSISLFNNGCKEQEVNYIKTKEKKAIWTSKISVGVTTTKLGFQGTAKPILTQINFQKDTSIVFSFDLGVKLPGNLHSVSIHNETFLKTYKTKGSIDYQTQNYYKHDIVFKMSYIKNNTYVKKTFFPKKIVNPFLQLGLSLGHLIKFTNEEYIYSKLASAEYNEQQDAAIIRRLEQGFLIGGGLDWKRYNISFMFEQTNGFSGYASLRSLTNNYFVKMGFVIF